MDEQLRQTLDDEVKEAWAVLRLCLSYAVAGVIFLGLLRVGWITLPFHPVAAKIIMICSAVQLVLASMGTLKLQQLLRDRRLLEEEAAGHEA